MNGVIGVVTKLRDGRQMNRGSIPGRVFFFRVQVQSWGLSTFLFRAIKGLSTRELTAEVSSRQISSSTEIKKRVELHLSYRIRLYGVHRDSFTFLGSAASLGSL